MVTLQNIVAQYGVLSAGQHTKADGKACVLEAAHAAIGDPWSDTPSRWPDLRPLNDGPWSSDQARTEALVPVLEALWDWEKWPHYKRTLWVKEVILQTVRELLPPVLTACGLQAEAAACGKAGTFTEAARAVYTADIAIRRIVHDNDASIASAAAATCISRAAGAARSASYDSTNAALLSSRAAVLAAYAEVYHAAETYGAGSIAGYSADGILVAACKIWCGAGM